MPYSFNPLSGLGLDQSIPLDGAGKIPSDYLPSYVDDVVEYANLAGFPATGETGKIYVAIDTGFTYRWSGSVYIQINSLTGTFAADAGTAAAPSISIGTADNGLYAPAEDQLAISTNGTGRLFVDANGNVGVGGTPSFIFEAAPDANRSFAVDTAGSFSLTLRNTSTDAGADLAFDTKDSLQFKTDGTERLRITSAGLVGIGTSSPNTALDVNGTINVRTNGYEFGRITTNNVSGIDGGLSFQTISNGTFSTKMVLDAAGKLGIGTTVPNRPLHLSKAGAEGLQFALGEVSNENKIISYNDSGVVYTTLGYRAAQHFFEIGTSEKARIDSSGRLLVGTSSSPTTGQGQYARIVAQGYNGDATGGGIISIQRGSAATGSGSALGQITFGDNTGATFATINCDADGTVSSASDLPGRLVFSTTADGASSPTEHVRINSAGTTTVWGTSAPMVWGRNLTDGNVVGLAYYNTATSTTSMTGQVFRVMCDGDVENTNNAYGAISDITLKENIVDANSQWEDLKALQVRNYNFKPETGYSTHTQIGLVAQELELVSPGLVGESIDEETGESTKTVNYSVLYMKAVKALQEAMERIEVLETKVNALEGN